LGRRHEPPNASATDSKLSSSLLSKLFYVFFKKIETKKRKNRNRREGRKHSRIANITEAPQVGRSKQQSPAPKKLNVAFTKGMTPEAPMMLSQEGKGFHPLHP
jgi:hypothetical protein